jgi:hypothetical protein
MRIAEQNIRVDEVDAMLLDVLEALFLILFKNHCARSRKRDCRSS